MKPGKMKPDFKPVQYLRISAANWICAMMTIFVFSLPGSTLASNSVSSLVIYISVNCGFDFRAAERGVILLSIMMCCGNECERLLKIFAGGA